MRLRVRETGVTIRVVGGPLPGPLGNARASFAERRGLLLRLRDDEGVEGLGEASPLPGHSGETLAECAAALAALSGKIDLQIDLCRPLLGQFGPALPAPAAARFAVETALLDLLGKRLGTPIWRLLSDTPLPVGERGIPIAALLPDGPAEAARDAAAAARARGIGTVKLKIGRAGRFAAERALALTLHEQGTIVRLDANGAWGAAEAAAHLAALRDLAPAFPEFIEEPGGAPWPRSAPVPLAADESLRLGEGWLLPLLRQGLVQVVVLKPMLLGGFLPCLRLARRAAQAGAAVVVTHLLDGPVALGAAAQLALSLPRPPLACGLDRHPALAVYPEAALPFLGPCSISPPTEAGLGVAS